MEPPLVPHDYQEDTIRRVVNEPTKAAIIADEVGLGKAQPLDALILTPEGFKPMGAMRVGQEVVTPNGGVALIDGIYPQGIRPIYELTLADGRKIRADQDHIWMVNSDNRRWRGAPAIERTTKELLADLHKANGSAKWAIDPISAPDLGQEWGSSIDPYFLGLLLGDGCITQGTPYISSPDEEILDHIRSVLPEGVSLKHAGAYDWRISGDHGTSKPNPITVELRRLGLMGKGAWDKSIPEHLLNTGAHDRHALLQGLMDTDGSPAFNGADFLTASVELADQVLWLIRSLGGKAKLAKKVVDGKTYQRINARTPSAWPMFRLARKAEKVMSTSKYANIILPIKSIEYVGEEAAQCIHLDSPEHEYVTDNFTRTHNTLQAVEIALRLGWRRALVIGINNELYPQWKSTLERQSRGSTTIRKLDSTKAGREVFADFLAGKDGFYYATMAWLIAQDFEYRDKLDIEGNPIESIDKKTGLPTGKFERERIHLKTFLKMSNRKNSGLDAVVFDEVHTVSSHKAIGRKTLLGLRGRDGAPMWKIGMSATWSGNSFENAWSVPEWCWPDLVPAYWFWRDKWCKTEDQYIGRGQPVSKVVGELEPGAWVKSLPCYLRREQEEKAPEAIKIYVDPTPLQAAQYADLERDLMTWIEGLNGVEPLVVDVPGALYARFKQLALAAITLDEEGEVKFADDAPSAKLGVLRGILDRYGAQPVGIFTDSKKFANLTVKRMRSAGYNAIAYTGDTPKRERARIKDAFIAGEYQYLVGTVQSMGTGLDGLQRVCSKVVWLSKPDGDPKLETQALGRYFRQGRTLAHGAFEQVAIVQRGSQDEKILENLIARAASVQASVGAHNIAA